MALPDEQAKEKVGLAEHGPSPLAETQSSGIGTRENALNPFLLLRNHDVHPN